MKRQNERKRKTGRKKKITTNLSKGPQIYNRKGKWKEFKEK